MNIKQTGTLGLKTTIVQLSLDNRKKNVNQLK